MKKYIIIITSLIIFLFVSVYSKYVLGFYIIPKSEITSRTSNDATKIYLDKKEFKIKGVNIGSAIPGHFATDFAIDKKTYLRWFKEISEMGANSIRVYTILSPEFYDAFYEFNKNNPKPLYLIHGVWVNDYIQNSRIDALNPEFMDNFIKDIKVMIDVIHGKRYIRLNDRYASGLYTKDISKWVLGYIVGVEWEDVTVSYTDHKYKSGSYQGKYLHTKENTTPFVNFLAEVGDKSITYESRKYGNQRLFAYSNWPTTDPFTYSEKITKYFKKCANVDVENIVFNDNFKGGTFASYHVYPYYPDYLNYEENKNSYRDKTGNINTYYAYLKKLNKHHNIPVVISEFGVSTGRGMAQKDQNTGFNQGKMDEVSQGKALVSMYESIMDSGSAGGIAFTWQDEWFKRTWNTMQNVDLNFTPYWSDVQTNEQYFGLLSFDPGKIKSKVYIDGNIDDWEEQDILIKDNKKTLSLKYDEKYIYVMTKIKNYNKINYDVYIPLDITPNSGSKKTNISSNTYDRNIDFLIKINGKRSARIYVQEYYDALLAAFSENITGKNIYFNPPKKDSKKFNKISLMLQTPNELITGNNQAHAEIYETGLLKYGNGNPNSKNFNSLADYIIKGDIIELRIPWQLLNFRNPSKMEIHDDYYKNYGIEGKKIKQLYIGLGLNKENISLKEKKLKPWNININYHERLKKSYYILKEYWTSDDK